MTKPLAIVRNVIEETRSPVEGYAEQTYTIQLSLPTKMDGEFARNVWVVKAMREIRHVLRYGTPIDWRFGVPDISSTLLAKEVCDHDNTKPEISALVLSDLLEEEGREDLANAVRVLAEYVNKYKPKGIPIDITASSQPWERNTVISVKISDEDMANIRTPDEFIKRITSSLSDKISEAMSST